MLSLEDLTLSHGARDLFEGVSLRIKKSCRYGLVGANGTGKTTFLKVLSKEIEPTRGGLVYHEYVRVGSLKQDYYLYEEDNLIDVVLRGKPKLWKALEKKRQLLEDENLSEEELYKLAEYEMIIGEEDGYAAESQAAKLLMGLGFEEKRHCDKLSQFSGGYKMRVMLAQLLFGRPDLLLLDEPTNYLDILSISWLEMYLKSFAGSMVVSSHDRYFLNQISTDILDVDYGTITPYKGNYEDFLVQKQAILEGKEQSLESIEKKQKHLQEYIDRFGAKASKASQAQSKAKVVGKLEEEKKQYEITASSRRAPSFRFPMTSRPPSVFVRVEGICKSYGEKKVLENVSFELEKGDKLAVVGPNGIGKSTLLEILNEKIKSDVGKVLWSEQAEVIYFPQNFEKEFDLKLTVEEWFDRVVPTSDVQKIRGALGACLLKNEDLHKKIEMLSGGEKARLYFAKMMLFGHNIMILDEPTSHLDLESCEALVRVLKSYEGGLIFVSHDRYFISQLGTRILELSFEGSYHFQGGYEEYIAKRERDFLSKNVKDHGLSLPKKPKQEVSPQVDQNELKELKKSVKDIEKRCLELENELSNLTHRMTAADFYTKESHESRLEVAKQKNQVEQELEKLYISWENNMNKLQQLESF